MPTWLKLLTVSVAINLPLWLIIGVVAGKATRFLLLGIAISALIWIASLGWVWVSRRSVASRS